MPGARPYTLRHVITHPLARMLPLQREQEQVYRLGEKHPPAGELRHHAPMWESVSFILAPRDSARVRVNLQRDFTLLAITNQASVQTALGGFRAQMYDTRKELRMADRGILAANISGTVAGPTSSGGLFYLREPYQFDQPDSQLLIIAQNMETAQNTIQIALYGLVLRFNEPAPGYEEFPGGVVSNLG
jgi:hypothetical protein